MPKLKRRTLLAAALAAPALRRARAADYPLKFGSNLPAAHPLNLRMAEAAARIGRESGGRVELQLFPNNQLGGDTDMISQTRSGALEFMTLSGLILATLVPVASLNGIGFAFHDYDQVWHAMDGELGAHIRAGIGKAGLVAFDRIWDNGFRQVTTSTHPINGPDDFHGLKIRVPVSPLWTSIFKALGAAPTSLNLAETYSALQTRIVEGQENPLAVISTTRFYEVQKYCSLTGHMWDGYWFIANADAFNGLPDDLRGIVTMAVNDAAIAQRADVRKLNESLRGDLESKGLVFNTPDTAALRAALRAAGFYKDWRAKYGEASWAVLERAVGDLG